MRVVRRETDRFSGMRFFLGVFGWLTATGLTVLLLAGVAGVGALTGVQDAGRKELPATVTAGAIVLAVVLLGGIVGMRHHRRVDRAGIASLVEQR